MKKSARRWTPQLLQRWALHHVSWGTLTDDDVREVLLSYGCSKILKLPDEQCELVYGALHQVMRDRDTLVQVEWRVGVGNPPATHDLVEAHFTFAGHKYEMHQDYPHKERKVAFAWARDLIRKSIRRRFGQEIKIKDGYVKYQSEEYRLA